MSVSTPSLPAALAPAPGGAYSAFRFPAYRHFVIGRAIFLMGMRMQAAAAAWQIFESYGTSLALAWVGLIQFVPVALLALPAGHLADRFRRRRIVMVGQVCFASLSVGLAVYSLSGLPPAGIYVFLFLLTVARSFIVPALVALMPAVTPKHAWVNATAWNSTLIALTTLVGPGIAGLMIAACGGSAVVYVFTAACALVCVGFFSRIRVVETVTGASEPAPRSAGLRGFIGGFGFLLRNRLLLVVMSLDLVTTLLGGATALLPLIARDVLQTGPQGYGWLLAAPSLGALSMAFFTAHRPPWRRTGRVLLGAIAGFGAATVLLGLSRDYWLSFGLLTVIGAADNLGVVIRQSLIQFITPDDMRGRVGSVNFIFIGCSNELGGFRAGISADAFGAVGAIVSGGVATLLIALVMLRLAPSLRRLGPLHELRPAAL